VLFKEHDGMFMAVSDSSNDKTEHKITRVVQGPAKLISDGAHTRTCTHTLDVG
jgi:hypothetical protein